MDDNEAFESFVGKDSPWSKKSGIMLLYPIGKRYCLWSSTLLENIRQCSLLLICIIFLICGFSVGLVLGSSLTSRDLLSRRTEYLGSIYKHSPAYDSIAFREMIKKPSIHIGPDNQYSGAPTPTTNEMWKNLLRGYNIRVPRTSMGRNRGFLIPLDDGSNDVWASFGVYHHLHCLDSLRHQIYGKNCISHDRKIGEDGFPIHLDHCLENLRQWLICLPDLTPRSVIWRQNGLSAVANNTLEHTCVDWNSVQDWIDGHIISGSQPLIRNPAGNLFDGPWPPPPRCAGF